MKEPMVLALVGLLFVLASVGALVGFVTTEPLLTLDGLMELFACLLMVGVFSWFSLSMWREAAKQAAKQKEAEKPPAAPAAPEKTA